MIRGIFVTGTDTGVGKTIISSLLAESLVRQGIKVGVMKPYLSGGWGDARALKKAARSEDEIGEIAPAFYSEPLAPFAAATRGNRVASFQKVRKIFWELRGRHERLIVEGIGGALVPLEGTLTVADMAKDFGLPVWIVARAGLGTLNHTLLTLEALRRRKVFVERIILNRYRGNNLAERTNPSMLKKLTGLPVTLVPPVTGSNRASVGLLLAKPYLSK